MGIEKLEEPEEQGTHNGMEKRPYWRVWIKPTKFYHRQDRFTVQILPVQSDKYNWRIEVLKDGEPKPVWETVGTLGSTLSRKHDMSPRIIHRVNRAMWMLNCIVETVWSEDDGGRRDWKRATLDDLDDVISHTEMPKHKVHEMTGYTDESITSACPECNDASLTLRKNTSPSFRCPNGHEFEIPKYRQKRS